MSLATVEAAWIMIEFLLCIWTKVHVQDVLSFCMIGHWHCLIQFTVANLTWWSFVENFPPKINCNWDEFGACCLLCNNKAHLVLDFGGNIKYSFDKNLIFHFLHKNIGSLYEAKLFPIKNVCSIIIDMKDLQQTDICNWKQTKHKTNTSSRRNGRWF